MRKLTTAALAALLLGAIGPASGAECDFVELDGVYVAPDHVTSFKEDESGVRVFVTSVPNAESVGRSYLVRGAGNDEVLADLRCESAGTDPIGAGRFEPTTGGPNIRIVWASAFVTEQYGSKMGYQVVAANYGDAPGNLSGPLVLGANGSSESHRVSLTQTLQAGESTELYAYAPYDSILSPRAGEQVEFCLGDACAVATVRPGRKAFFSKQAD